MVETMRWQQEEQVLELLDQTLLPQKCVFIACRDYLRVKLAIQRLEVRGAPAIGAAAGFAMVLGAQACADKPDFLAALANVRDDLISARPTAVNLAWAANKQYNLAVALNEADNPPYKAAPLSAGEPFLSGGYFLLQGLHHEYFYCSLYTKRQFSQGYVL